MLETLAPRVRTSGGWPPTPAVRGLLAALALLVLALTGCVAPTPTTDAHRASAGQTVTDLLSAVNSGVLVAAAHRDGKAFSPYLETVAWDAESAARSIADTYGIIQPPSAESDLLRARLVPLCDDAVNALADLRIALRRDDSAGVAEAARLLTETADALERLEGELS
ncbi:hypothetical protein ABZ249_00130 [Nocardiopsis sp. NPDC006139]|uniref:hypothetical protein n=1 Tax=unclassified Nocardiopsis TaxID=2649073 RepID=UPI0033AE3681